MKKEDLRDGGVVLETGENPAVTVIWLHGLGADGHDFEPIVAQMALPKEPSIRFIFPNAPVRPVTINGGMRMRSWYDIAPAKEGFSTDEQELRESSSYLESLIKMTLDASDAPDRLFLAGFSQGGAVALHTALRTRYLLSGVIALSTYLPLPEKVEAEMSRQQSPVEVFMAHGTEDPVINIQWAIHSRDILESLGVTMDWREYHMEHTVCLEETIDLSSWLHHRIV